MTALVARCIGLLQASVFLTTEDGETLVVSAQSHEAAVLQILPAAAAISVPTTGMSALTLLAVLLGVTGCFRQLRVQNARRRARADLLRTTTQR